MKMTTKDQIQWPVLSELLKELLFPDPETLSMIYVVDPKGHLDLLEKLVLLDPLVILGPMVGQVELDHQDLEVYLELQDKRENLV